MTVVRGTAPRSQFTVKILLVALRACHKKSRTNGHVVETVVAQMVVAQTIMSAKTNLVYWSCRRKNFAQPVFAQIPVSAWCLYPLHQYI